MKKILKTTVAALAILTSACALASCGDNDKPNEPSLSVPAEPSDTPTVDPTIDESQSEESSESTSTVAPKPTPTPTPTPTPSIPEVNPKDYFTFDRDLIRYNLSSGDTMPADGSYDIYAYYTIGIKSAWVIEHNSSFKLGSEVKDVMIALVKKGKDPKGEGNILATITNITIAGQSLVFENMTKPEVAIIEKYHFNTEKLIYNFRDPQAVAEGFDTFVYYWYGDNKSDWILALNGEVELDNRVDGAIIVAAKKGTIPSWDEEGKKNILTQTDNLKIENHQIILEVDKPIERLITIDTELIPYNLKEGNKMPDVEYDIYVYLHDDRLPDSYVQVVNNHFKADERYTLAVLILVKKGESIHGFDNALAQTTNAVIEGTNVIFNEDKPAPYEPEYISYSFNRAYLEFNLKNGKTLPAEYDLYLHTWGEGMEDINILVKGDTALVDTRATGAYFVLVEVGKKFTLDYNNGCLGRTTNLIFGGDNKLIFNLNEAPFNDLAAYKININDIPRNLKEGNSMPSDYDTYLYWEIQEGIYDFYHVTSNRVVISESVKNAKFVLIKKGMDASWSNESILAETTNAIFKENHVITFANPSVEDISINVMTNDLIYNLAKGSLRPTGEYDIYAHAYNDNAVFKDVLVDNNTFIAASDFDKVIFLFMEKGSKPSFGGSGYIAKTTILSIKDATVEIPNKKSEYKEYTYNSKDIEYNLKDNAMMPEEYTLYLHYWGDKELDEFVLVDTNTIMLPEYTNGCQFVLCKNGIYPTTDKTSGCLAITDDCTITEKEITLPIKAPKDIKITFDLDLIEFNLMGEGKMPEGIMGKDYQIYIRVFNNSLNKHADYKLVENTITAPEIYNGCLFVIVKPDSDIVFSGDKFIAQTEDLKITDGTVVFKNPKPADKLYTFDINEVIWNLKDNKFVYNDNYDVYLHYWGKNLDKHAKVTSLSEITLDERVEYLQFVVVEKDKKYSTDYGDGCLGLTPDIDGKDSNISLLVKAPTEVMVSFDLSAVEFNLVDGNKLPEGTLGVDYDAYIRVYQSDIIYRDIKLSGTSFKSYDNLTNAVIRYVPVNYIGDFDSADILASTLELTIEENKLIYPNQKPEELILGFDLAQIQWNLIDSKVLTADKYDVYLHYWGLNYDGTALVTAKNEITLDTRATNFEFVVVESGHTYTKNYKEGCLGITVEATLNTEAESNTLVLPENTPNEVVLAAFNKDLIKYNLKEGLKLDATDYDIYLRFKTASGITRDYKLVEEEMKVYDSFISVTIIIVTKGSELVIEGPNYLAETLALDVLNGVITFKYQIPEEKLYTFDSKAIAWNLIDGKFVNNSNYDLYIHYLGYNLDQYMKINGLSEVKLDNRVTEVEFVLVEKGNDYTTDYTKGCLGKTDKIDATNNELVFNKKAPKDIQITVDLAKIEYNMKPGQKIPTGEQGVDYDLYVRVFIKGEAYYKDIKLIGNTIFTTDNITNALFIYVKHGKIVDFNSEDFLGQTEDLEVKNESIIFPNQIPANRVVTFDTSLFEYNLDNNAKMPTGKFEIFAHLFNSDGKTADMKVSGSNLEANQNLDKILFVFAAEGTSNIVWDGNSDYLCQTITLDIVDGVVVFKNGKPTVDEYTISLDNIEANLLLGDKKLPLEYETYLHVWGKNIDTFIKVNGNTVSLDSRVNGGQIILVKVGDVPTTENYETWLNKTSNVVINEKNITLPDKNVEYKINLDDLKANMFNNASLPTEEYDIYAHVYVNDEDKLDVLVNQNIFTVSSRYTNVILVFIKKGSDMGWEDSEGYLSKSNTLGLINGKIGYPVVNREIKFTVDPNKFEANLKNGQSITGEYKLYAYLFGNNQQAINVEVVNSEFIASGLYTGCILVFVKKDSIGFTWDTNFGFMAQTNDLVIQYGEIIFK